MTEAPTRVRSFIDLAAFAARSDLLAASGDGAWEANRQALSLPAGPVGVAVMRLSGQGSQAALAADEFVIVLDGALTLHQNTDIIDVPARHSVVIPASLPFSWTARTATTVIVMRCASGPAGADRLVPIDEAAALTPSNPPLADLLVGPTPSCRNFTDYRSANGEFVCGTWDSTPYTRVAMPYRHYELMHLTQGAVTFVDGAGRKATYCEGDVFLVEQGAECSWESTVQVKKVYAIYRPA
ncbi:DUF861 domain-containing protein [Novosphingobium sp. ERN07]|uniref:cupin domain-containing protein n=1 Tax=Novosphingobium sp. ERN07 TaxID=2726187 RepID=UPI0014574B76|nr:cupin domain-containing protein [Novosphingobium sp. ERN07]NLR71181.1 DUF861 domain-containing protein [Novosphingobium sp. ERN07]